jgi:FkbM family methyltransferase
MAKYFKNIALCQKFYNRKKRELELVEFSGIQMELDPFETVDGALLFYPQLYDWQEVAFIRNNLSQGAVFFDIGANIGSWTLANIDRCDKIITIEASPITFDKLVNNIKNDKIVLLNYAVCNNNGNDITFYHANCDTISTINKDWLVSEKSRFYNSQYTEIICKTITIDNLIEKYGVPELIKIDVEGGEYECITSLTQKIDLLCFEWASETNDITIKSIDYLFKLGFINFYIQYEDNYTFRPNNNDFYDIECVKEKLALTVPKHHWGMIWCK